MIKTAFLLLIFFLIYAPTYTTPYIMDDSHTIQSNQFVQSLDYFFIPWLSAKAYSSSPENYGYRPLTVNFSQICWFLGNGHVTAFQIAKKSLLAIFAGLCLLLWSLWQRCTSTSVKSERWWGAGGLAFAFFLFHPVNTQVASYIAASSTLLCGVFFALGFYFYLKFRQSQRVYFLVLGALSYFLSVMSKEEGITLIAILVVAELFYLRKSLPTSKLQIILALGIYAAVALFSTYLIVLHFESSSNIARGVLSRELYFATQWHAYLYYLGTYIWPFQFNFDHLSFEFAQSVWTLKNIFYLTLNIIFLGFGLFLCRRRQDVGIAIIGFYISILPASSIIPLAEAVNDHRHFIPFLFMGFGIIRSLQWLSTHYGIKDHLEARLAVIFLVILATSTLVRNFDFASNRTIWTDTVLKNPNSPRAKNNLALDYMAHADYDFSKSLLRKCIDEAPYYYPCFINYAITSSATGDDMLAEKYFRIAASMDPNLVSSRLFFADFLISRGRDQDAKIYLEEANQFTQGLNKPVLDRLNAVRSRLVQPK